MWGCHKIYYQEVEESKKCGNQYPTPWKQKSRVNYRKIKEITVTKKKAEKLSDAELENKIISLDWERAKEDVRQFIRAEEQPSLDLWCKELFLGQLGKLEKRS